MKEKYMNRFYYGIIIVLVFLVPACIVAQGERPVQIEAPSLHERIENQQTRIDQGIVSGALTRSEANTVQDNLNWIKADYSRMTKDGRLTPGEVERLTRMLDQNSNMIYNKKNNPVIRLY
jgi:hypothetical protein